MRVLAVNAPGALARDLQQRANATGGMQLMIADVTNPLVAGYGSEHFVSFSSRRKVDFAAIATLRRTIRYFQPDIVHSFLPRALSQTVLATVGMRRQPKIVSFYGITRVPSWREPADWITYLSPKVSMHACESNAVNNIAICTTVIRGAIGECVCRDVATHSYTSVLGQEAQNERDDSGEHGDVGEGDVIRCGGECAWAI